MDTVDYKIKRYDLLIDFLSEKMAALEVRRQIALKARNKGDYLNIVNQLKALQGEKIECAKAALALKQQEMMEHWERMEIKRKDLVAQGNNPLNKTEFIKMSEAHGQILMQCMKAQK